MGQHCVLIHTIVRKSLVKYCAIDSKRHPKGIPRRERVKSTYFLVHVRPARGGAHLFKKKCVLCLWRKGEGGHIQRGPRKERGKMTISSPITTMAAMPFCDDNDGDGITVRHTGRSPSILDLFALCAMQYSITPSWWGRPGEPSSTAPLLSSVGRRQRQGEGPGLVGGDRDRGPRSGVHPAGREVQSSCGSSTSTWRRQR